MKKVLAVLSSALLLISSLCCGIVLTTAGEAETTPLIFDFTTQDCYDGSMEYATVSGSATHTETFNTEKKALQINFQADGDKDLTLSMVNDAAKVAVDKYDTPVMAIRYYFEGNFGTGIHTYPGILGTKTYNGTKSFMPNGYGSKQPDVMNYFNSTTATTLATTVNENYLNGSYNQTSANYTELLADWANAEWNGVSYRFRNRTGAAVNFNIYIEWIGFFENEAAADGYVNGSVCLKTETDEPEEEITDTSLVFDYTTQDCFDGSMEYTTVTGTSTHSESFNATKKALEIDVTADDEKNLKISAINEAAKVAANKYTAPVFAIRYHVDYLDKTPVFLHSYPYMNATKAYGNRTEILGEGYAGKNPDVLTGGSYTTPTTFATAIVSTAFTSTTYQAVVEAWNEVEWQGVTFELRNRSANETRHFKVYIEWMGFFANEAAADSYEAGSVCLKKYLETDGKACNQSKDSLAFRFKMTANGVGYADPAAAAANTNFSRAALDGATMTIDGAERTVTDYGMLVSTVAGTEDADLTNEAVNGAKVRKVPAANLYDAGTGWVQFAVLVKNITAHADNEVFARAYVEYTDANGDTAYAYSDIISTTLNEAIKEVG